MEILQHPHPQWLKTSKATVNGVTSSWTDNNDPGAEMTAPTPHPPGTKSPGYLSVQNGFTVKGHVLQLESNDTNAPEHWIASSRIWWTTMIGSINCRKERHRFNCPVTHSRIQCVHIRLSAMGDTLEKQIGKTVDWDQRRLKAVLVAIEANGN